MDGPRDCHIMWSQTDTERQISYDIAYKRNLKKDTNEYLQNRNRLTDIEKKTYGFQSRWGKEA